MTTVLSGGRALLLGHPVDDPAQDEREERLGRARRLAEEDRGRVAEAALELPRHAAGVGRDTAAGRFADEDLLLIVGHEDDGGDRGGPRPEHGHLGPAVPDDGGRREGRAQVDAEAVTHETETSRPPVTRSERRIVVSPPPVAVSGRCTPALEPLRV